MIVMLITNLLNVVLVISVYTEYLVRKNFNHCEKKKDNKIENEWSVAEFCEISL